MVSGMVIGNLCDELADLYNENQFGEKKPSNCMHHNQILKKC